MWNCTCLGVLYLVEKHPPRKNLNVPWPRYVVRESFSGTSVKIWFQHRNCWNLNDSFTEIPNIRRHPNSHEIGLSWAVPKLSPGNSAEIFGNSTRISGNSAQISGNSAEIGFHWNSVESRYWKLNLKILPKFQNGKNVRTFGVRRIYGHRVIFRNSKHNWHIHPYWWIDNEPQLEWVNPTFHSSWLYHEIPIFNASKSIEIVIFPKPSQNLWGYWGLISLIHLWWNMVKFQLSERGCFVRKTDVKRSMKIQI